MLGSGRFLCRVVTRMTGWGRFAARGVFCGISCSKTAILADLVARPGCCFEVVTIPHEVPQDSGQQMAIDVVGKIEIDGFTDQSVDAHLVAGDWWRDDGTRLLPGEEGGATVFEIEFFDGCRFFSYTVGEVSGRLAELMAGPLARGSNDFVREHGQRMAYLVRCVASGLELSCACQLLDQLVSHAPRDSYLVADTAVTTPDCWLGQAEPEPEVLLFSEWMNERLEEAGRENPE